MATPIPPPSISAALPTQSTRPPVSLRWLVLLGLSILLHWLALHHVEGQLAQFGTSPPITPPAATTVVNLLPAPAVPVKPTPSVRPKARAAPRPVQPQPTTTERTAETENILPAAHAPSVVDAPVPDSVFTESLPELATMDDTALAEQAQDTASPYRAEPLPSAILKYDVEALREGNMVYGSGKIHWHSDGQSYAINGEASVLFFTLLDFESQGVIDEHGVSPVLYTQKRFRKAATNTHFHRERNLISFSASTLSYPRQGGEQDRASLIWQLAAIGRANPGQFVADKEIGFLVAGVRDLQNWDLKILAQEEVETGVGKLMAWRVARIPPPGSYEQKLDMWLAPELGWYPVKLRHTDYNGEYLDMILSDLAAPLQIEQQPE